MAIFRSTGLVASDSAHTLPRLKRTGLLKSNGIRHSKQHMVEEKMFGSRMGSHGKDFQIGRKFSAGKFGLGMKSTKKKVNVKGYHHSGISPDLNEFENMMKRATGTSSLKKKATSFRRQQVS